MNRPKVVVYGVVSVDGKLTLAPDVLLLFGDKRWDFIAKPDDNVEKWLKSTHKPQAYLEGSASFVKSNEVPKALPPAKKGSLYADFLPKAVINRPGHRGWFTVIDSRGRVRWVYKEYPGEEYAGWHLLVLVSHQTPLEYLAYLQRENIPYIVAGKDRVDLGLALEKLNTQLGVTCVLSTSPGRLGGALLRAGLVDEINIEFVPAVIGGFETPSLFRSPELKPDGLPTRLKLISAQVQTDGRIWVRYKVISQKKRDN